MDNTIDISKFENFKKNKKTNKEIRKKEKNVKNVENVSRQNKDKNVAWTPFKAIGGAKFSSQEIFLNADHISQVLYTGSRYIGKSDALIALYLKHVGAGYKERWRGVIVRKTYKSLLDIIKKAKKMISKAYPKGSENEAKFIGGEKMMFIWKSGEELHFRSCANEQEYEKFHGQEYPFIGMDELSGWEDSTVYDALLSCNRTDCLEDELNPPVIFRATTNPFGKGKNWIKKYFIDPAPIGRVITETYDFEGEEISIQRLVINGNWKENPYADRAYIAKLFKLKDTNYAKFRAWLFGDWDVVVGGAFGDIYDPRVHLLEPFEIPSNFKVNRSYDDGTTDPFSILFWAEATSDSLIMNGKEAVSIPKGSLILINEIYGAEAGKPNKGLRLSTKKIAELIIEKERQLLQGLCCKHREIEKGPADYMIWANSKVKGFRTVAKRFEECGISWKKTKKHGAIHGRKNSVAIFKEMLVAAVEKDQETPHIYFFNCNRNFLSNVINLRHDEANPDDIDQKQPDHDWDACRYRITYKTQETAQIIC